MFAIEFGANATAPAIVMNSAVHAREWITVTSTQYLITQLLNGYGTDPVATDLLNTFRWRIVPIMNPDGYEYTWSTNRMWRKNRRQISSICTGVDNNRNWGKGWVSQFVCDETYPGTSAFSEIETQSMAAFVRESENAIAYIDVHSYSQLWMYPWGDTSKPVKDKKVLDQVSDAAVKGIAVRCNLSCAYRL
jgi:murein tripeptide amidase MpaA